MAATSYGTHLEEMHSRLSDRLASQTFHQCLCFTHVRVKGMRKWIQSNRATRMREEEVLSADINIRSENFRIKEQREGKTNACGHCKWKPGSTKTAFLQIYLSINLPNKAKAEQRRFVLILLSTRHWQKCRLFQAFIRKHPVLSSSTVT